MMKLMLTGGKGMLGRTICRVLTPEFEIIPTDLPEVDITSPESLRNALEKYRPDAVIHCAAMTAVDRCESEKALAFALNGSGTANVAAACKAAQVKLVAISTDYVFRGDKSTAYSESDCADGGNTVYGQSKFAGEKAVQSIYPENSLICRISWLYGDGGPSFVHTMLKLADGTRQVLKVVDDQRGNPTSAVAVARKLGEVLLKKPALTGVMHMTCEGEATWAEFAREIFRVRGVRQQVSPCTTAEFPRPAPRPANSCLLKERLQQEGFAPMPRWQDALVEFMANEF